MKTTPPRCTEEAIWSRLIQPRNGTLPPGAARGILAINFSNEDQDRMHELAQKNGEGQLLPAEREELHTYIKVADVLALLHAKAKRSLAKG